MTSFFYLWIQSNAPKMSRTHYSGPLLPPEDNLEEMLKEHERQIQQAVRKARLDKDKIKKVDSENSLTRSLFYKWLWRFIGLRTLEHKVQRWIYDWEWIKSWCWEMTNTHGTCSHQIFITTIKGIVQSSNKQTYMFQDGG